ncbi:MAG: HAD family hydrolase [Cellvibrionaceae bacterium]
MTSIKLAFFDVDGTLIGSDGKYSERTKKSIARLHDNGIKTAIASGRPPFAAQFLFDELGISDTGLFYAGAAIYDPKKQSYLKSNFLNRLNKGLGDNFTSTFHSEQLSVDLLQLISVIKEKQLYSEVYTEDSFYTKCKQSEIYKAHSKVLRSEAGEQTLDSIVESKMVFKLLIGTDVNHCSLALIESDFPNYDFAYAKMASHPNWMFASITSTLSSRKKGFDYLCEVHDVTSDEVIAFGDAQSDQVFIENAGVGVAMGDAPKEVKLSANIVTETADENGVAKIIEQIFG